MRRPIIISLMLLALAGSLSTAAGARSMTVLFVGNSHTYFNDLPELFIGLADAADHYAYVDQSTFGGYTLAGHAENSGTLAKIAERRWDHVVLQEHSLYPVIEYYCENSFYPAARTLDSLIAVQGSGTSFFMTWGWEFGGEHCIGGHCSPDFADYNSMQGAVAAAYGQIAAELDAFLVPVGNVWAIALHEDPDSPLWHTDHYHPGPEGSYLAACVFFARFFDESPVGLDFYGSIDQDRALFYQEIAALVVTSAAGGVPGAPAAPRLLANHPNPFNPRTALNFELTAPQEVILEIFDPGGRLIEALDLGTRSAGRHQVLWNADDISAGVYFCRLSAGSATDTRKLTLIK